MYLSVCLSILYLSLSYLIYRSIYRSIYLSISVFYNYSCSNVIVMIYIYIIYIYILSSLPPFTLDTPFTKS